MSPDESRLGGDGGSMVGADGGTGLPDSGPGHDGGVGVDAYVPPPVDGGRVDSGQADAGPGDSGPPTTCDGLPQCVGGVVTVCQHGMPVSAMCPLGCAAGAPRCLQMIPSNVPPSLWSTSAPPVDLSRDATLDTSDCTSSDSGLLQVVPQSDAPVDLCVLSASSFRVQSGATLRVVGSRPLVIMVAGQVHINGTIDASATLDTPGAGGFGGGVRDMIDGMGADGGGGGVHVDPADDGGGGGGGLSGPGGAGGVGSSAPGGSGGGAFRAAWELVPLFGGSGGGRGRGSFLTTGTNAGLGGAGGGALQISARVSIDVRGTILVGGGGGRGGSGALGANWGSGGGGGSGGAVLLEAPAVTFGAAARIDAAGGGGGAGASAMADAPDGTDGRDATTQAAGGRASGGSYGGSGGNGGGGTTLGGADGSGVMRSGGNGGGGGGGAGFILVRDADGSVPAGGSQTPSVAPGLRALPVNAM